MTAFAIYRNVADAARQPILFEGYGVPDTITGRFDMLIAHAILALRRLNRIEGARAEEARARAQAFSDVLFKDLDRALRDTGVSDRKVPKRLKLLATAYLGRAKSFGEALDAGDEAALAAALERNSGGVTFLADAAGAVPSAEANAATDHAALAAHLRAADAALAVQDDEAALSGELVWPAAPEPAGAPA